MISIQITQDEMPSPAQFEALLDASERKMSDVDVLNKLLRELTQFEQKYDMTSDRFHQQFMAGEMDGG